MTVGQLIRQLETCDPDEVVYFEFPSHDYLGTVLATEIKAVIIEPALVDTAQHPGYKKVVAYEEQDYYEESEYTPNCVMLTDD